MKWNKFQGIINQRIHPLFKNKIQFKYPGGCFNKLEILFEDKVLAVYICDRYYWRPTNKFYPVIPDNFGESLKIMNEMMGNVNDEDDGIYPKDFANALFKVFNNLPIKEALNSDSKLIRAIALMDKRCGSRTFKQLDYSQEEDFLLRNIYNLRKHLEKGN